MKLRKNNPHNLEIMGDAPIEFQALGPVDYKAERLLTYAVSEEFVGRAMNNADVVGIVTSTTAISTFGAHSFDGWIISDDPQADFFKFHNWLAQETKFYRCFESKYRFQGGCIHIDWQGVEISNGAYIEIGATIGYPGARFVYSKNGERISVAHVGGVRVCEGAHIGANAVIVKSVWPRPTRIGKNAFIGNLVNVGHGAQVGDGAVILSGAILGGSCIISEGATVGLGAIIRPRIRVGAGAIVSMGSVVTQDVPADQRITGNFAIEHMRFLGELRESE